ncbi:MAG: citramalate synthase [Clostridia bacterium]|nr:citramalate synthase [Clostridia bacterium]
MSKIEIFDSTLRDGAQGESISFSVQDKLDIIRLLDDIKIDYIEAGNPASNPKDAELFEKIKHLKLKHSKLVAFGPTRRKNSSADKDTALNILGDAPVDTVSVFGKCWDLHVSEILHTTNDENINMIADSIAYLKAKGKQVFFDAEHFFDGFKSNKEYALKVLSAAVDSGADRLVLCDTNGGTFYDEISDITAQVILNFPNTKIAIHCHNDCGMAVASSVAAVYCGADQVQGTFIGIGERCGNTSLASVIANLQIKRDYQCIPQDKLSLITPTARHIAEIANTSIKRSEPYIGSAAFTHKAGMHADGVVKNTATFEHIEPSAVGNKRKLPVSEISGKTAIHHKISRFMPQIGKDEELIAKVTDELKRLENQGYQFEAAQASFQMLCRRLLSDYTPSFKLISYNVSDVLPYTEGSSACATIKVEAGGETKSAQCLGEGPVNALDKALRESLKGFFPQLKSVHLIDYKVRVMDSKNATGAVVRVLITSTDGTDIWTTVGASCDIIEASWIALCDSIEYKLNFLNQPKG